ncbi:alpha/beta hydrolase [Shewanella sp. JM162201]|uniref:Alpha/beta hydrolase n=1 Tax=Shewanella jiangmenensis TaxID=2837387 RepID=A0ABS5UZP2_9GAMM|nr:alpha/beta hydrolase [Shewanella jiangmenensis]MBT1443673.1 alpha/beta hydrolase [Shewanella jiangmenensis]
METQTMHAIFIHGLGRTPLSGLPLLMTLRRAGIRCHVLGYLAATESVESIANRLAAKINALGPNAPYVLIGHSLGGVISRYLLTGPNPPVNLPKMLFLLGSPVNPSRLAARLQPRLLFRLFSGDAGQLLGSKERMAAIGAPSEQLNIPCCAFIGTRGISTAGRTLPPFYGESNDGVVALSEVTAPWLMDEALCEQVEIALPHTLLPSSSAIGKAILMRLERFN